MAEAQEAGPTAFDNPQNKVPGMLFVLAGGKS
jgi:hypothetical protein